MTNAQPNQPSEPAPGQKRKGFSSFLYVDGVSPSEKADWVKAANKAGLSFPEWVNAQLNLAAKKKD